MTSHTVVERRHGGRRADGVRVTHSRFAIQRNSRTEWEWLTGDRSEDGCGQRTPSARLPPCHRSARASSGARRFGLRRSRQSRYLEPRSVKGRTVMPGRIVCFVVAALAAAPLVGPTAPAVAQSSLNVYCSVQLEWCQALAN